MDVQVHGRVLVLLASRNGEEYISQQVSTLLRQSSVALKIFVRDDNSTDRTREVVSRLAGADDRVALWGEHEAKGSAAANFFELILGSDVAEFDYVAFCDQDDEWNPDKLARAISRLRSSGAAGYSAGVEAFWPDGRKKRLIQNVAQRGADYLFEGAGQGCTFVMTAQFFSEIQKTLRAHRDRLRNLHYHDWTVYALARAQGRKWYIDDVATMAYRQHSSNDTGARGSFSGIKRRASLIASGWYQRQVNGMVDLILAVRPDDPSARAWRALSSPDARGLSGRMRRLAFVAVKGRRRPLDRGILMLAVIFGYL